MPCLRTRGQSCLDGQNVLRRSKGHRATPTLTCVASLIELVRAHTDLDADDVAWLQLLQADWQIIADLSFADLVLWLPDREGTGFWAGGQMRPTTGPTAYVDDIVGTFVPAGRRPHLDIAYAEGRLVREGDPEWRDDVPVRAETIPVRRGRRVIAVVGRNTNLLGVRTPSRLELSYLQTAADLTQMIAGGHFPVPGQRSDHADTPRVGDGFLRVDEQGRVVYASPNALSVYRRLGHSGDLDGLRLSEVTRELVPPRLRPDEETLSAVLGGRANRDAEIGTDSVSLIVRAIPLRPHGRLIGALVLVRDVTDLRSRDRELVTKDATIREIHHRVKNNLQTVAALLRLQARRMDSADAKAALEEAVRRVGSIAIVHETLSQAVEESVVFDDVADRLGAMVADMGSLGGRRAGTPRGLVRRPALGDGDHGGDGADRAAAERRRARLPGRRQRGGHHRRDRRPDRGRGSPSPSTTTGRGCRPASTWPGRAPWGSRSWARWSSPSSAAGSRSGRRPSGARHPGRDRRTARASARASRERLERQAVRTRARALRRFSARRSSSLRPPQTPWSCPASRAHWRHCSRTSQRRHTCLASSIWRMAGPVLPIGKNSSGSSSRHAERWRQSMAGVSFFLDTFGWSESWCRWGGGAAGGHTAGTAGRQPRRVRPACRELDRYTRGISGLVGHRASGPRNPWRIRSPRRRRRLPG